MNEERESMSQETICRQRTSVVGESPVVKAQDLRYQRREEIHGQDHQSS